MKIDRQRAGRPQGDAGVAGVLVLALAGVLALVGAVSASLGAVAVARQRAAAVADLAALAAADASLEGEAAACDRAQRVATANAAVLASCRLAGDLAVVVAEVRPPGPLGRLGVTSARARAGPIGADSEIGRAILPLSAEPPERLGSAPAASCLRRPASWHPLPGACSVFSRAPPTPGVLPHAAVLHRPAAARPVPILRGPAR